MQNNVVGNYARTDSDQGVSRLFGDSSWPFNLFAKRRNVANHQSSAASNVADVRKATKKEKVRDCHRSSASPGLRRQKGVASLLLGGCFGSYLKVLDGKNDPRGSRQGNALG